MGCILSIIEAKNKKIKNSSLEVLSESQKIAKTKNLENKVVILGEYDQNNSNQINEFKKGRKVAAFFFEINKQA